MRIGSSSSIQKASPVRMSVEGIRMERNCATLGHNWIGCKCSVCGCSRETGHQWVVSKECPHCGGKGYIEFISSGTLSYGDSDYGRPFEEPCHYHEPTLYCCLVCGKVKEEE